MEINKKLTKKIMNPPKSSPDKQGQKKIMTSDERLDFLIGLSDHAQFVGRDNRKDFNKIKAVVKSPAKLAALTKIPVDSITKVFKSTDLKKTFSQFQEAVGNEYKKIHTWITDAMNKGRGVQRHDDAYKFEVNLAVEIREKRKEVHAKIKKLTAVLVQAIKGIIKEKEE